MNSDSTVTVVASNARETTTGAESRRGIGVDVDVRVTFRQGTATSPSGDVVDGEVTLLPAEDGRPVYERWGSAVDHWLSGNLVGRLYELRADEGMDAYCDALTAIEGAAAREAGTVQARVAGTSNVLPVGCSVCGATRRTHACDEEACEPTTGTEGA